MSSEQKRVLMVAYHFPPLAGSSGIQRTLRFVQHLPRFGWQPLVLTVHPRAYERTSPDLLADVPEGTVVQRAFALDTSRHLSIAGRYFGSWARPDCWISWRIDGVRQGMRMIRDFAPAVIFSTHPIPTAHVIGAELHARSKLPWIADFRDPMAQDGYPPDPRTWASFKAIEERAMQKAALCVFTTPGATQMYGERYPSLSTRFMTLENGYDEETFMDVEREIGKPSPLVEGALTLLHSGIVYPSERDPTQLFEALQAMKQAGELLPGRFMIRFRAAVHEDMLHSLAVRFGVAEFVETAPAIPYREALAEMLSADALLVLQASNCNDQVPAKVYEYLRARRPVLCLSDPSGDTACTLRDAGIENSARLDSVSEIRSLLLGLLRGHTNGLLPRESAIVKASRLGRTKVLAEAMDQAFAQSQLRLARTT